MNIAAIVLAAGASRRMGQPKQIMELNGEALVHRTARIALQAGCKPTLVVLGCEAEAVGAVLSGLPCSKVINTAWEEGMASSIHAGVLAVPQNAAAALLLACDQPAVNAEFIRLMIKEFRLEPNRIVASAYSGTLGIPALFPRRCFEALKALTGDRGARALLEEAEVLSLPLPDGELDVDTLLEHESMRRRLESS